MREIEITHALTLDERQRHLLDGHSVFNVLNVVLFQVEQAGSLLDDADLLVPLMEWVIAQVSELRDRLGNSNSDLVDLRYLAAIRERLREGLLALRPRVRREESELFERYLDNLESVFDVADTRVEELIERGGDLHHCRTFTLADLSANWRAAFTAIANNSFCSEQQYKSERPIMGTMLPRQNEKASKNYYQLYGHQFLARQNVAAALAQKVADASMSLPRAKEVAAWLFVENPKRLFGLDRFLTDEAGGKAHVPIKPDGP